MKKLIALLLGLALLCGCTAAFAEGEELPYLETIPNDNYYGGVTTLTDIPMWDSPVLIANRAAVPEERVNIDRCSVNTNKEQL